MITNTIKYGGLLGKTKSMFAKRITDADYAELKSKPSVSDIAMYLRSHPGYSNLLSDVPDRLINRISLETLLTKKAHMDYIKLLKFTSDKDKNFLKFYIYQNEMDQILKYIRLIISNKTSEYDYVPIDVFKTSSRVDFTKFKEATTFSSFVEQLEGTPYHSLLTPYKDKYDTNYTNLEVTLQTYFFKTLFELLKNNANNTDKKEIKKFTEATIDLLNFSRILRCITIGQDRETVYSLLIPFAHSLSQKVVSAMINSGSYKEAYEIIKTTPFKSLFESEEQKNIESYYYEYVFQQSKKALNSGLPSLQIAYAYIWLKEIEIKNLINIIEAKSYNLSNEEIDKFLVGIKKER